MAEVTYNGAAPVMTPTLAADGDVTLGLWQPGESKEVPDELAEGLCAAGSAFSSADDDDEEGTSPTAAGAAQNGQDQAPDQDREEKPRRSLLARARGDEA